MFSLFIFYFCIFHASEAKFALCGECPNVKIHENDFTKLIGKWQLEAGATDFDMQADSATVVFNHKNPITIDIAISWVVNNTARYYNVSATLTIGIGIGGYLLLVTHTDQKTETYSVLDVNYEHYAVILVCYDIPLEFRTYKLWKLTRSPPKKNSWKINAGNHLNPATFILSSAAAISLLRRL